MPCLVTGWCQAIENKNIDQTVAFKSLYFFERFVLRVTTSLNTLPEKRSQSIMSSKPKKSVSGSKSTGEEITISSMKKELELEQKAKDTMEWSNAELERSVRAMEANVIQLESGNFDADDSEIKQKYENQRQLNVQLQEQKRWLEHELEQVRLKIQNEKQYPMPDPFSLDWDNLSETELKRLVGQLEKTRNDLKSDLRERQWRLDKEGKEFHHYDDFCRMYMAEIKNLNRILESLMRTGMVPTSMSSLSPTNEFHHSGFLESVSAQFQAPNISSFGSPNPSSSQGLAGSVRRQGSLSPTRSRPNVTNILAAPSSKSLPRRNGSVNRGGDDQTRARNVRPLPKIVGKVAGDKTLKTNNSSTAEGEK